MSHFVWNEKKDNYIILIIWMKYTSRYRTANARSLFHECWLPSKKCFSLHAHIFDVEVTREQREEYMIQVRSFLMCIIT